MSQENVEIVREIHERWKLGDFSSVSWAHPEIEFSNPAALDEEVHQGIEAMAREWARWLRGFEDFRSEALEFFEAGDEVVTINRFSGRGRGSGVPIREIPGAARFVLRDGKVVQLAIYTDPERAFEDAGIGR